VPECGDHAQEWSKPPKVFVTEERPKSLMSNNVEVDELAFMYSKSGNGQTITHKNVWEADAIIPYDFKC
jgi:hypothetical protein